MNDVGMSRGETGDTVFPSIMLSDVDKVNSPATSTPGSTPSPTRRRDEMLKDSELQDSEMSIIDSSVKEKEEDDEIEVIGDSTALDGKSVERESQDAYDSSWEAVEENERGKKDAPKSCVAQRTRSQTGERRKKETSLFLGDEDTTMGSMLEESGNPMDSITLSKEREWKK